MGTMLYPGGAAFRVWAPFAPAIFVAGTFNQWNATANPFASEGNGYWSVDVPGAGIGDEYQFVIPDGGNGIWHKNPYASEVVNSSGNAIIHDPNFDWTGDNFMMPPWNELVIYEMHVGTFADVAGGGPGTFETVIPKLAYLADLGINAIEIMPVAEFPMSLSWGYNPAEPFSVETAIGGPRGLHEFVKAAHAHGIAVLLDVVYNHFGPGDLDLWRFDGWSSSDHNGGIYFYDNARAHTPWGDTRPDYGRPEVRQYIRDNALFWLDKYRLDGLRFDSVINIRNRNGNNNDPANDLADGWSLLQWVNDEIRGRRAVEDHDRRGPAEQRLDHPRHGRWRRWLRLAMGRGIRPSDPRRDHRRQRRRSRHESREPGARSSLRRRCGPAGHLHRVTRRSGQRSFEGAGGNLARRCRQLVLAQALDPRRRDGVYRSRHPDDLPGPGVPRGHVLSGQCPAGLDEADDLRGHPRALPRSDSAPPQLVQSDARSRRPAAQRPPCQQRRQGSRLSSLGRWRAGRRCRGGGEFRQPQLRRVRRSGSHARDSGACVSTAIGRGTARTSAIIRVTTRSRAAIRWTTCRSEPRSALARTPFLSCPRTAEALLQPFGTCARKRRGLSTRTRRSVASSTPAFRSIGPNTVAVCATPGPPFFFKARPVLKSDDNSS